MADLDLPPDASVLEKTDVVVAEALVPHKGDIVVRAIGAASELSDQEPLYAGAAAVIATGVLLRDGRTVHGGTRVLATHLLATGLRGVIKQMVDRTRPDVAARDGYEFAAGERYFTDYNSFPSGHSAGAVAAALAAAAVWPGSRAAGISLAGAAAGAQVLRSKHYVSDIVAGAAIGLVAHALIGALVRRAERV
jgi:membrane-associated phospholipid phosphatase